MPGLKQLETFTKKILSLGDENVVRLKNGDKRRSIPMPQGASEADDSDDFIYGLPSESTPEEEAQVDSLIHTAAELTKEQSADNLEDIDLLPQEELENIAQEEKAAEIETNPFAGNDLPDLSDLDDLLADIPDVFTDSAKPETEENLPIQDAAQEEIPFTEEPVIQTPSAETPVEELLDTQDFLDNLQLDDLKFDDLKSDDLQLDNLPLNEIPVEQTNFDLPSDIADLQFDENPITDNTNADNSLENELLPRQNEPFAENFSLDNVPVPELDSDIQEQTPAGMQMDSDLSSLLSNVEDLLGSNFSGGEKTEDEFDELPSESDLPSIDDLHKDIVDTEHHDFPDLDFGSLTNEAPSAQNTDFSADLPDSPDLKIPTDSVDIPSDSEPQPLPDTSPADFSMDFSLPEGFNTAAFEPTGTENSPPDGAVGTFDISALDETPDINQDESESEIPLPVSTEFTEEEYKRFLINLHALPLNLRVSIEEIIAENQFTDEVTADIIRQIINKTSVRKVAAQVGKITDKSIDIPREFEKRTAAQYELYKQSVEYQVKNRVLPTIILSAIIFAAGVAIYFLGNKFVYRPIRAELAYMQGYKLIENKLYQQSEHKFNEAVNFLPMKNWYLKFAAAYREQKQYELARRIYELGLRQFKDNKKIGLEYARMELNDTVNYENADRIVRREVLDTYINDAEGMLLLGDILLEWATEKDPSKFEEARSQYATLMELYGTNDLYLSRMLRYFIRTDNLREVLPLKEFFLPKKKALEAMDLIELSGYLLEKQYGALKPADEHLRALIEDVRLLLERAVSAAPENPEAHYNFGKYLIYSGRTTAAKSELAKTTHSFSLAKNLKRSQIAKHIDTYRLLGNLHIEEKEFIAAEEQFVFGIQLLEKEKSRSNLEPNELYGRLYASLGDINYFISNNLDSAYTDYQNAVQNKYDTPQIRYKLGYIQYTKKEYAQALSSFIKTASETPKDKNLLYALGNTLSLRNDFYASQAYYELLIQELNAQRIHMGVLYPQTIEEHGDLVNLYMHTANNLGVSLQRLARQTGDSAKNAQAMVQFSDSSRAWDALTRNQTTLVRLEGTNLAAQNLKYIAFPFAQYQPEIYIDINRTLQNEVGLTQ